MARQLMPLDAHLMSFAGWRRDLIELVVSCGARRFEVCTLPLALSTWVPGPLFEDTKNRILDSGPRALLTFALRRNPSAGRAAAL